MDAITSQQRKQLRSLAHHLDPSIWVGKQGVTDGLLKGLRDALLANELVKVRFQEFKSEKKALAAELAEKSNACLAGVIGHVAILYRPHPDPKKREVKLD